MVFKSLYPPSPELPVVNYHSFLFARPEVAAWPDYTVYIDGITGERVGFKAFTERVEDAAAALAGPPSTGALGIRPEDKEMVGVLSENCLDYPVIVMALLKIAVPFVLFPSWSTAAETKALVKLSSITRLFVSPRLLPIALATAKSAGLSRDKIYLLYGRAGGRETFPGLIKRVKPHNIRIQTQPVQADTLAYLVFSSGTSGLPKGVMISHRNLAYSAMQVVIIAQDIEKVHTPPPLNTPEGISIGFAFSPLYHAMGLHIYILRHFLTPSTCVIIPKWDVNVVLDAITRYKISALSLVPAHVHQLVNAPKFKTIDLSGIVTAGGGAAYLPVELRAKLLSRLKVEWFIEGYGMSECSVSALYAVFPGGLGGRAQYVPGMTGVLLSGMQARIVREDGTDADIGEPGELFLHGPNVGLGYWNNEEATRESFLEGGWLRTGDRFRADEEGRFFYVDRMKDTLKISGVQVSPSEIEVTLLQHPGRLITDVAVAGVAGTRMTDEKAPRAWIVLSETGRKKGRKAVVEELDAWVKEQLSKPKWVRGGFRIVDEIPKSPTGKVLRRVLQEGRTEASSTSRAKL